MYILTSEFNNKKYHDKLHAILRFASFSRPLIFIVLKNEVLIFLKMPYNPFMQYEYKEH